MSNNNFKLSHYKGNFPFSTLHEKKLLTHLTQMCTNKLNEIDTKTKKLFNQEEIRKNNQILMLVNNFKEEEEKRKKLELISISTQRKTTNNDYLILKLRKMQSKEIKGKSPPYYNKSESQSIKSKTTPHFYPDKSLNHSKTSASVFMTHLWGNKSNLSTLHSPLHLNSQYCKSNTTSFPFNPKQLHYSNSCKTFSPIKAKYQYISDTLVKSIKENQRFNRNLNFYMSKQRKNKVSKSFPKKGKSKRELELEGHYEELTEKMRFTSTLFKEHYISYKNKRTGNYHIIRSGYADLMNYIDNYSRMEDGLFFKYKDRASQMYPAIQEAADIQFIPGEDELQKQNNKRNNNKIDQQDNMIFNEKDISPTTRKMRNLVFSLQMKKNKLMNRLNDNIGSNNNLN